MRFEFTDYHAAIAKKVLQQFGSSEVLAFLDYDAAIDGNRMFQLVTDASKEGFGEVLEEQKQGDGQIRSLVYISRTTLPIEKTWDNSDLECGALLWAIKKNTHFYVWDSVRSVYRSPTIIII